MNHASPRQDLPRAQLLAERAFATLERFLHIEAVSACVLLAAAAAALIWANSPLADSYHALWHANLELRLGALDLTRPLHFWINDGLMTVFFLVVGMEIRREMHEGSLRDLRQASLPLVAALGGVAVPAFIYLALNESPAARQGWAVPTATDIAFALGVLALLGRGIPGALRVFLLALAIIDDLIAVLIIAFFYSGGLDYAGFAVAGLGVLLVLGFRRIGIGSAFAYLLPGMLLWGGLLMTGAHPTLAGVVLGLLTPVVPLRRRERPLDTLPRVVGELVERDADEGLQPERLTDSLRELRLAQRELLPPVVRVQAALHPWVAYGVMPLFALANAGVHLDGVDLSAAGAQTVALGVTVALVLGKPLGIIAVSWLVLRLGCCRLPAGLSFGGLCLVGLLAGIGFTMSLFIAMLAFEDAALLSAAKLGILLGSAVAALLGLGLGLLLLRRGAEAGEEKAVASPLRSA